MSSVGLLAMVMPMSSAWPIFSNHLGGVDDRLARDAAHVQAHATDVLALDDRGLDLELTQANGGGITAGTRTDDDRVEALLRTWPPCTARAACSHRTLGGVGAHGTVTAKSAPARTPIVQLDGPSQCVGGAVRSALIVSVALPGVAAVIAIVIASPAVVGVSD